MLTTNRTSEPKPVLAVDIDEVLAQFLYACNEWHNHTYGTHFQVSDYCSYTFCETWGCTDAEALVRVYTFFDTSYFEDIPPVKGALEALEILSNYYELAIVTSRQLFLEQRTKDWLMKHFPNIKFSHILFGNQWVASTSPSRRISKKELCQSIGAIALIDDLPKYILETAPILKLGLLFDNGNAQKWSKLPKPAPPNVITCLSWEQITTILIKFHHTTHFITQPETNLNIRDTNLGDTPMSEADNDSTEDSIEPNNAQNILVNNTTTNTTLNKPDNTDNFSNVIITPMKI